MRAMHQAPRSLCIGLRAARSEVARVEAFCVHGRFSAPARQDRWCAYFGARRARFDTEHLTTRVEAILTPSPSRRCSAYRGTRGSLARALEELELGAVGEGEEAELVVRRVLSASGGRRGFLNGRLVPQQVLARLTRGLTDISSQHEHHTLSDP